MKRYSKVAVRLVGNSFIDYIMYNIMIKKGSYSVKRLFEIASYYGYSTSVVQVGCSLAFVVASNPFFRSPYPNRIESNLVSYSYALRMFYKY